MAARFPSITYSELTSYIAQTIYLLVSNIGNNYNQLPDYHTNSSYQKLQEINQDDMVPGAKNATAVWNVWLDANYPNYIRKVYDHSKHNFTIIKEELDGYLKNNGVNDIESVIEQGSFLGLVHNLITFVSNRIVIHTSQEDNGSTKYVCYDSYITNELIKNDTKMPEESVVVSVPSGGDFKIVEEADIKRIIDSLTRLIKKPYRFSGTYYNFDLLGGKPGSPIALEVTYDNAGSGQSEIESKTVFTPKKTWTSGTDKIQSDPIQNYSITTVDQTADYKFVGWYKKYNTENELVPFNKDNNEATISTTKLKLTLLSTYLWTNGVPNDNAWINIICKFQEKQANNTTFTLNNIGDFTKDSDSSVSCNMIGKDSVTYTGCVVNTDNNETAIQYSVSSNNGDFSINSTTGAVTCTQPGTATVSIRQDYTLDVKSYSGSYTINVTMEFLELTSNLFTFTAPSGGKPASFRTTVEGIGSSRIIKYSNNYKDDEDDKNPGTWTDTVPTKAGTYYCSLTCDQGTRYKGGTVFDPAWKFTITSPTTKT